MSQEIEHLQTQLGLANARTSTVHKAHIDEINAHLETKAQALLAATKQNTLLMKQADDLGNNQKVIDALQKTVNALTQERDDLLKRLERYEPQTEDAQLVGDESAAQAPNLHIA